MWFVPIDVSLARTTSFKFLLWVWDDLRRGLGVVRWKYGVGVVVGFGGNWYSEIKSNRTHSVFCWLLTHKGAQKREGFSVITGTQSVFGCGSWMVKNWVCGTLQHHEQQICSMYREMGEFVGCE